MGTGYDAASGGSDYYNYDTSSYDTSYDANTGYDATYDTGYDATYDAGYDASYGYDTSFDGSSYYAETGETDIYSGRYFDDDSKEDVADVENPVLQGSDEEKPAAEDVEEEEEDDMSSKDKDMRNRRRRKKMRSKRDAELEDFA